MELKLAARRLKRFLGVVVAVALDNLHSTLVIDAP